jgi:hypothetical protein
MQEAQGHHFKKKNLKRKKANENTMQIPTSDRRKSERQPPI